MNLISQIIKEAQNNINSYDIPGLKKSGLLPKDELFFLSVHYPPRTMCPKADNNILKSVTFKNIDPISLYIHIPFCNSKCTFCHFYSTNVNNDIDKYLNYLGFELNLWKKKIGSNKISPTSIFIGGGTPTILNKTQLRKLFDFVHSNFNLTKCKEFNIEAEPRSISKKDGIEKLKIIKDGGVTRICLGAQIFDDKILRSMNRPHNVADIYKSITNIKLVKINSLSLDLIYGYPEITTEIWTKTLIEAHRLNVDSYQLYHLAVIPYGPQKGKITSDFKNKKIILPDISYQYLLKEIGRVTAKKFGFKEYFTRLYAKSAKHDSHYSQDWCCRLNNVLGLGLSSWSSIGDYFTENTSISLKDYYNQINAGKLPIEKGLKRTRDIKTRRNIIMPLKNCSISKINFRKQFNKSVFEIFPAKIKSLKSLNLIDESNHSIKLSKKGKVFADNIAIQFYKNNYLPIQK